MDGTYVSLDVTSDLRDDRTDPAGFVSTDGRPLFIDEVQRGGDPLVLAIKTAVDLSDRRGQFVLAGSTRFLTEPRLSESLAGRARFVDLWPLSRVPPRAMDRPGHPLDGALLESFVVNELLRQTGWSREPVSLSHWRDRTGREVDVIVETGDRTVVGVEVKATVDVTEGDFLQTLSRSAARNGCRGLGGAQDGVGDGSSSVNGLGRVLDDGAGQRAVVDQLQLSTQLGGIAHARIARYGGEQLLPHEATVFDDGRVTGMTSIGQLSRRVHVRAASIAIGPHEQPERVEDGVKASVRFEPFARVKDLVPHRDVGGGPTCEVRHHELVLRREVQVHARLGHASHTDDLVDSDMEAPLVEQPIGRVDDPISGSTLEGMMLICAHGTILIHTDR